MTPLGEQVVFTAFDFDHGVELWASDGTTEGTRRLADICPGPCHSLPTIMGRLGEEIIFPREIVGTAGRRPEPLRG